MIGECGLTQPLLFVFCRSESMAIRGCKGVRRGGGGDEMKREAEAD